VSLFGFLGKVATGFLAGGPAGALAGAASSLIPGKKKPKPRMLPPGSAPTSMVLRTFSEPLTQQLPAGPFSGTTPMMPQYPDSSRVSGVGLPGGAFIGTRTNYYPPAGGGGIPVGTAQIACAKGYHANKSGYFTKRQGWIAPGTVCVKNRRRNPLNPRALSRSIARISSAKNAAKFLGRVSVREPGCK